MLVHPVAHREHHRVARDHRRLAGADGRDAIALALEPRLLHLEAHHAALVGDHPPRGGEEAKAEPGAGRRLRLGPGRERREQLVGILAGLDQARADPLDLLPVEGVIEGVLDVLEFAVVVGLLEGPASGHRDDLVGAAEVRAVVGDVHHDVADPDDGDPPADRVGLLAEGGQVVVVIDEVLGVVDAGQPLALDPQILGALRADGEDQRVESEGLQVRDRHVSMLRHSHVSEVGYAGITEDLLELAAEAALHLVLVQEDAVFGEAAGLDVPVEQDDAAALGGQRAGREESRRAGSNHCDEMKRVVRHGP